MAYSRTGCNLKFGGIRDGVETYDVLTTAYVGGQPAMRTASGVKLAEGVDPDVGFIGIFANKSTDDAANGNATVLKGNIIVDLWNYDSEGAPFDDALSYAVQDALYIDTNGLWSNATPGASGSDVPAGATIWGRVKVAPASATDVMTVEFLVTPAVE